MSLPKIILLLVSEKEFTRPFRIVLMNKCYPATTIVLLAFILTGCLGLDLPVNMPDYSLGPISSDEFPDLLNDAIPASEGEVHVYGKVYWDGFCDDRIYPVMARYFQAVAAITNTDMLLLKWYEPEKRYKIVKRVPYSEILSVSKAGSAAIYLYFADREMSLGGTNYVIFGKTPFRTFLQITSPSGFWVDKEKTKAAFLILRANIKLHESARARAGASVGTAFEDQY